MHISLRQTQMTGAVTAEIVKKVFKYLSTFLNGPRHAIRSIKGSGRAAADD
jgi:hypothetical protein